MRIAVISTPFVRVPPFDYGGTELFCGHLAEALLDRGHDVTLFATGDSEFSGELKACFPTATWPPTEAADRAHIRFCLHEISRDRQGYDAVQINSAHGLQTARELGIPVVYTLHHHRDPSLSAIYAAHPEVTYVAISARQLELETPLRHASVIYHGVDPNDYPPSVKDAGYLVHLGRIAPEKGTHLAIDAAVASQMPLVIAGRVHDRRVDRYYFEHEVAPRLTRPGAMLVGDANMCRKVALLRGARAALCPIQWEEPFGLVAIEAMLTGTPVIGFARGAFPEVIDEGITGILVSNVREMTAAIHSIGKLDRRACANRARERFSVDRMAAEYESVFESTHERVSGPMLLAREMVPARSGLMG